jgi:hypothetical protein
MIGHAPNDVAEVFAKVLGRPVEAMRLRPPWQSLFHLHGAASSETGLRKIICTQLPRPSLA